MRSNNVAGTTAQSRTWLSGKMLPYVYELGRSDTKHLVVSFFDN